jgi:hypothetical protein
MRQGVIFGKRFPLLNALFRFREAGNTALAEDSLSDADSSLGLGYWLRPSIQSTTATA